MNLALILKLIDAIIASKPGSKGRVKNLSHGALLGICSACLFYSAQTPEKIAALDKRVARIEWSLNLAASTNAVPDVDHLASGPAPGADASTRFTFTRKGDL